jgi:hypothetical protein
MGRQTARKDDGKGCKPPRRQLPRSNVHRVDTALLLRTHVATRARKVRTFKFLMMVLNKKSADQQVNEKWKSVVDGFTNSFLHGATFHTNHDPSFFIRYRGHKFYFFAAGPEKKKFEAVLDRPEFNGLVNDLDAKAAWMAQELPDEEEGEELWAEFCENLDEIEDAFLPYLWKRLTVAFFQVPGKEIVGEFGSLADVFEKIVVDPAEMEHVSVYTVDQERMIWCGDCARQLR